MATIRQTDCKTGWQVIDGNKPIATYRRRVHAVDHVNDLARSQEQIVSDMEMDKQAARDGYNPNR